MPLQNDDKRRTQINMQSALVNPYLTSQESLQSMSSVPWNGRDGNTNKLLKKREVAPHGDIKKVHKRRRISATESEEEKPGLKPLKLVKAIESGIRAHQVVLSKRYSPWKEYEEVFQIKLDGFNTVATRRSVPCDLVIVKSFVQPTASERVDMLRLVQHRNFIALVDHYILEETSYVALEYVGTSLDHVVSCPAYPTELQLAAILGQVLFEKYLY
jgi:hypothetical protein